MMVKGGIKATSAGSGKTVILDRKQSSTLAQKYGDSVAKAIQKAAEKGKAVNKTALVALLTTKGSKLNVDKARQVADKIIGNAKKPVSGQVGNPLKDKSTKTQQMSAMDTITKSMHEKEKLINDMNKRIRTEGESKLGKEFMDKYEKELNAWDKMKVERDKLKQAAFEGKQALGNKSSKMASLKMDKADYQALKTKISDFVKDKGINLADMQQQYKNGNVGKDKDMRFRWDIVHAAKIMQGDFSRKLYDSGLNDSHIDSALKSVMNELIKESPATPSKVSQQDLIKMGEFKIVSNRDTANAAGRAVMDALDSKKLEIASKEIPATAIKAGDALGNKSSKLIDPKKVAWSMLDHNERLEVERQIKEEQKALGNKSSKMAEPTAYYTKEMAVETLQQLVQGPTGRLTAMIGANNIAFDSKNANVSFKFKARAKDGINYCRITLTTMDDYTVEFGRVQNKKGVPDYKKIKSVDGAYAEDLKGLFEETTGLYLSL
jgi:hypothetical protein